MFEQENYFNIMAIDPGNNIGISILQINVNTLEIMSIISFTYVLSDYIDETSNTKLLDRCIVLNKILLTTLNNFNPLVVVYEEAFMNSRFPKSIIQLSQYINTITTTIRNYNSWIKVFSYPPKYIKKFIGAGGTAEKDDMKKALLKIPEVHTKINLNNLTEHSIDSISIGYIALKEIRECQYILWSF